MTIETGGGATTPAGGTVTLGRGLATLGGAAFAALSGLLLAILVGRSLGIDGAGVFFAIVALVTIASTVLRFGADTAQLWRFPRLIADGRQADLRRTAAIALLPSTVIGLGVAAVSALRPDVAARLLGPEVAAEALDGQLAWALVALAVTAPMTIAVAGTRGLGHVRPYVLIQNLGLPLGRLVGVVGAISLGLGAQAVMAGWSLPALITACVAVLVLYRQLNDVVPVSEAPRSVRDLAKPFWRFAAPRGATAAMEAVLVSVNIIVVGMLHGPAAAGAFGALSRFITSGALADQAVRVLVAPRFSALLGRQELSAAGQLNAITTPWVILASWPIFLTLAAGAPAVLGLFGPGFEDGARALTILAVSLCISQLAGTVPAMLLMSGRSDLQLLNRTISIAVLLGLNWALVPRYALTGAAVSWSAATIVNAGLAVAQVRWLLRVPLRWPNLLRICGTAVLAFVPATLLLVRGLGGGAVALISGVIVGLAIHGPLVYRWRYRLGFSTLVGSSVVKGEDTDG